MIEGRDAAAESADAGLRAVLEEMRGDLRRLVARAAAKEWYGTEEVAALLGKAEFTVREWCRQGRVRAAKRSSGRGRHRAWAIAHAELLRIQREGLLPTPVAGG